MQSTVDPADPSFSLTFLPLIIWGPQLDHTPNLRVPQEVQHRLRCAIRSQEPDLRGPSALPHTRLPYILSHISGPRSAARNGVVERWPLAAIALASVGIHMLDLPFMIDTDILR